MISTPRLTVNSEHIHQALESFMKCLLGKVSKVRTNHRGTIEPKSIKFEYLRKISGTQCLIDTP